MIKRAKRQKKFSVIDNEVYQNGVLTWEAQGMLSNILSKPDDWCVHPRALVKATEGTRKNSKINAVYIILRELKAAGFVVMKRLPTGKVEYTVYDSPVKPNDDYHHEALENEKPNDDYPKEAKPKEEKPSEDNHHALLSTDLLLSTDTEESTDPLPSETNSANAESRELVSFWMETMGIKAGGKRQADLAKTVKTRLKHFSAKDIRNAIIGCSKSSYHMGDNSQRKKYNNLELILRNPEKIETFADMALNASPKQYASAHSGFAQRAANNFGINADGSF